MQKILDIQDYHIAETFKDYERHKDQYIQLSINLEETTYYMSVRRDILVVEDTCFIETMYYFEAIGIEFDAVKLRSWFEAKYIRGDVVDCDVAEYNHLMHTFFSFVRGRLELVITDSDKLSYDGLEKYSNLIDEEMSPMEIVNKEMELVKTKDEAIVYALNNKSDEITSFISVASYLEKTTLFCFDSESMLYKGELISLRDCRVQFDYDYDFFLDLIIKYLDTDTYNIFRFVSKFAYMRTVNFKKINNQDVLDILFREIDYNELMDEFDTKMSFSAELDVVQVKAARKIMKYVPVEYYDNRSLYIKDYYIKFEINNNKILKSDLRRCMNVDIYYASMVECSHKFEFGAYVLAFLNYISELYKYRKQGVNEKRIQKKIDRYKIFYYLSSKLRSCKSRFAKMCSILVNAKKSTICLNLNQIDPYRNRLLKEICIATRCNVNKADVNGIHTMCVAKDGVLKVKKKDRIRNHYQICDPKILNKLDYDNWDKEILSSQFCD